MSTISVTILGESVSLPAGITVHQAIARYTPYGEEATVCRLNGETVRSIDPEYDPPMCDGDVLEILAPGKAPWEVTVNGLVNEEGEAIPAANHPMMTARFACSEAIPEGAILRKKM